jgi:hypothetical protein
LRVADLRVLNDLRLVFDPRLASSIARLGSRLASRRQTNAAACGGGFDRATNLIARQGGVNYDALRRIKPKFHRLV